MFLSSAANCVNPGFILSDSCSSLIMTEERSLFEDFCLMWSLNLPSVLLNRVSRSAISDWRSVEFVLQRYTDKVQS